MPLHETPLEEYLRAGGVAVTRAFHLTGGGGHAAKVTLLLDGGVLCIAKLAEPGDAQMLAMVHKEVAAWIVARELGWSDLVPATVLRTLDLPGRPSAVQAAVQVLWPTDGPLGTWLPDIGTLDAADVWRAALLDRVIRHLDRSNNNWIGITTDTGGTKLGLIDHGYAFTSGGGSSDFVARCVGLASPPDLRERLARLADPSVHDALRPYLSSSELAGLITDAQHVRSATTLPPFT